MNCVPTISKNTPKLGFKIKRILKSEKFVAVLPHNVWGKFAHSEVLF